MHFRRTVMLHIQRTRGRQANLALSDGPYCSIGRAAANFQVATVSGYESNSIEIYMPISSAVKQCHPSRYRRVMSCQPSLQLRSQAI